MAQESIVQEVLAKIPGGAAVEVKARQWVRERAVKEAEKNIRANGKLPRDFSEEEFEVCVADAEDDVWGDLQRKGVGGLLLLFGINTF